MEFQMMVFEVTRLNYNSYKDIKWLKKNIKFDVKNNILHYFLRIFENLPVIVVNYWS